MRPHQKLIVWNDSFQFVKAIYSATSTFPAEERFGLTSQLRRAAVSVPVNIAEGAARKSRKEFIHFLHISRGSISELDTLLLLSKELDFIDETTLLQLDQQLQAISRMLSGLIRKSSSQQTD